ncbi:multidrug effflux MFS transporter [Terrarubrum flagellatum]|uniref:multidrug effflux MFS transporter n=1 Tax=Terrirubrum flagellatum TaxID=2895980 RepID=UPI003145473B
MDSAGAPSDKPPLRAPLWLLGLLAISGTLGMHIFVPALTITAADLKASVASMQMTISVYIAGLAIGQLVYGPISDRFGRRPALMAGLTLYVIASVALAVTTDVNVLIAGRFVQALGGCAGLVLGRAIVRDLAGPTDAARRLAMLNLIMIVGPALAPIIGGALAGFTGWRSIMILLSLLGAAGLIATLTLLPETRAPGHGARSVRELARDYSSLFASPTFLGYSIGGGCATTSMYGFVSVAPFVFINELHRPHSELGLHLAVIILGAWLGSMAASRLLLHVEMRRLMIAGNLLSLFAALTLLAAALSGELTAFLATGVMFLFTFGAGVASPTALTQAISANPRVVGSASGLYGFLQMTIGAICTAMATFGDPAVAAAMTLSVAGVIAQISFWIAARAKKAVSS